VVKRILLTGASGFIGQSLKKYWSSSDEVFSISSRNGFDISQIPPNIHTVIHLAGIAHRMEATPSELYFEVNEHLTLKFAEKMKAQGIRHFIFFSTIKVYGDEVLKGEVNERTPCQPSDAYGQSKWNAEEGLRSLEDENFKVSVIRPPLVFGAGVKGNLYSLMKLLKKPFPLPFDRIDNQRSMVSVKNLIAMTEEIAYQCLPGIFLPRENELISTTGLVHEIRRYMNFNTPRTFSIPPFLRHSIKKLKPEFHARLFGSLVVNPSRSFERLTFQNPYLTAQGIEEMVSYYLSQE